MKTTALLIAVLVAGCAVQSAPLAPEGDAPDQADGAPTTPEADGGRTVDSPPQVSGDGGPDGGQVGKVDAAPEAAAPDATPPPSPDAGPSGPDAAPPTLDAGADSLTATDAQEAGQNQDAGSDSPAAPDAAPDAVPGDAGTGADPVCTSPLPACTNAISADEAIRATFTKPCAPEGDSKCGGVYRGVVETLPMVCRSGQWRLAGSWSGVQWVPGHECSTGCAAGKICNP